MEIFDTFRKNVPPLLAPNTACMSKKDCCYTVDEKFDWNGDETRDPAEGHDPHRHSRVFSYHRAQLTLVSVSWALS